MYYFIADTLDTVPLILTVGVNFNLDNITGGDPIEGNKTSKLCYTLTSYVIVYAEIPDHKRLAGICTKH